MKNYDFSLQPFKPTKIDLQIAGNISRINNMVTINFAIRGDLEKIEIPATAKVPTRKYELWETTCFEFFLGMESSNIYWEFNISPSGDWNVYRFENYREGMIEETMIKFLPFNILRESNALFLSIELDMYSLAPIEFNSKISTTTVVKDKEGNISYWAVKHCGKEADFHLPDSFLFHV